MYLLTADFYFSLYVSHFLPLSLSLSFSFALSSLNHSTRHFGRRHAIWMRVQRTYAEHQRRATKIQSWIRSVFTRFHFLRLIRQYARFQAHLRARIAQRRFRAFLLGVIGLQSVVRRRLAIKKAKMKRHLRLARKVRVMPDHIEPLPKSFFLPSSLYLSLSDSFVGPYLAFFPRAFSSFFFLPRPVISLSSLYPDPSIVHLLLP